MFQVYEIKHLSAHDNFPGLQLAPPPPSLHQFGRGLEFRTSLRERYKCKIIAKPRFSTQVTTLNLRKISKHEFWGGKNNKHKASNGFEGVKNE